ncbi:MAG TPA: glycosyltransferase family 2 protein [Acidimicrobiales bacterium]|nr:glycosyltransferase family 2 protein [Acidimicrobiales bacterium]
MTRPLLSAALIVRDEAVVLDSCLVSLAGLADEVVVVDTGSVDVSPAIASRHGARVVHHPWRDDFSEARNVALDAARGRWILYLDADERVVAGDRAYVEELLAGASEVAFRLLLRPTLGSTAYREYRLWRNDERIRFQGVIHETVVPAIHRVATADGRAVGLAEIVLQHVGYEGDQVAKHRRNLPLLRRQLEATPGNLFVWHHLARVVEGLGEEAAAEATLETALAIARAKPAVDPVGALIFADLVRRRLERRASVASLLAAGRASYPDNYLLIYYEGHWLIEQGRFGEAVERFEQVLAADPSVLPPGSPAYERRLLADLAHDGRASALFRAGRYPEAAAAWGAAEALMPDEPSYAVKRRLAAARSRRKDGR